MTTIRAHFDGKVIVPDEPVDLQPDQALTVHVEPYEGSDPPGGLSGTEFLAALDQWDVSSEDLKAMRKAIDEDCGRIDEDGW